MIETQSYQYEYIRQAYQSEPPLHREVIETLGLDGQGLGDLGNV